MSDCSTVFGHNSCKELIAGGILTCQQPSTCLSSSYCSLSEYCSSLNTCSSVCKLIQLPNCKTWYLSFTVYCDTTADCSSFSEPSVCKESVYGGSKTCQSMSTCRFQCSEDQYCDASNICRWTTGTWQHELYFHSDDNYQSFVHHPRIVHHLQLLLYAKRTYLVA